MLKDPTFQIRCLVLSYHNIPSQGSASVTDGNMSDVLLLAIYKGFHTP